MTDGQFNTEEFKRFSWCKSWLHRAEWNYRETFGRSFFTILASSACAQTYARNTDHVGAVMTAAASVSNVTI